MPWDKDFTRTYTYRFYQALAHLKQSTPALTEGGMKFLYAKERAIVLARFDDREALVAVVSGEDKAVSVPLALGSIGAILPEDQTDLFSKPLQARMLDDRTAELQVPAGKSYLIRCPLK